MSPWSWLKFTIFLWLLRKTIKLTGWLLLAAAVIAAWPVTVVAAAGYAAAWLRGWPPIRLYRTAAWTLVITGAWLTALEVLVPGWAAASVPGIGLLDGEVVEGNPRCAIAFPNAPDPHYDFVAPACSASGHRERSA